MYIEAKLVKKTKNFRETKTHIIKVLEMVFTWRDQKVLAICRYPLAFCFSRAKVGDKLGVFLTARTEIYKSELSGEYEPLVENYVEDVLYIHNQAFNRNH